MAERVLITGGAGCIGSELAQRLSDRGAQVTVFDNLSSGKLEHLEALRQRPNFRLIEGDLLNADAIERAVAGMDAVYHLAANPDIRFTEGEPTDKDLKQNTIATYNLLDAMRKQGVKRLSFSSSSAVYGISERQPIPEEQTLRPISLYGATKLACEALIGAYAHLFDMRCWIFRFANIVGPKVRKKGRTVIGDFIHKLRENPRRLEILGNGRQAKSYLRVGECLDAMLFVSEHASEQVAVYNLGCDDSISVTRIADLVVEALGLRGVEYAYTGTEGGWPGDVPRFVLDVSAVNRLGWKAQAGSEQAVREAVRLTLDQMSP
jgi:UDP-glucose 4-epimerase